MSIKVGARLGNEKSSCEIIIIRGSSTEEPLLCAGVEMTATTAGKDAAAAEGGPMVELGKRYTDEQTGIELLCTKRGVGPLTIGGRELVLKIAKPLPASD